jgi:hypothetical protein
MGWESKRSYPVDVSRKITIQATPGQIGAWTHAARKMGKTSPGAFAAWAADMYLALDAAYKKQMDRHLDECAGLLPPPRPSELKKLVDAAWHALDLIPEDAGSTAPGGITDPKGDLRRALVAIQDLEEL